MKKTKIVLLYNAPVILGFTILSFGVLVLDWLTNGASRSYFEVYRTSWADPLQYLRLFTHILGHSGFRHFYGNFLMILLLGPIAEEKYGSASLLKMILATAFVIGLLQVLLYPHTALLGASGIVFMLIILCSATNIRKGAIPISMLVVAVLYLGEQVINGLTAVDNVSQMAHIAGGVCGGVFGILWPGKRN